MTEDNARRHEMKLLRQMLHWGEGFFEDRPVSMMSTGQVRTTTFRSMHPHRPDLLWLELRRSSRQEIKKLMVVAQSADSFLKSLGLNFLWKFSRANCEGLDVFFPIRPSFSHLAVFDIAKMLAEMIVERVPHQAVLALPGAAFDWRRILIDYHCNGASAFPIAPFSPLGTERGVFSLPFSDPLNEWKKHIRPHAKDFQIAAASLRRLMKTPNDLEMAFVELENLLTQSAS